MDAEAALLGRTLAGRYHIERCIGRGGMAAVFAARQDAEPRELAVKVMKRDLMKDATVVKRFRREAKAAAMLHHPNTVRVLDYGVDGEDAYIAMELAKGKDLFQALAEERPMTQTRSVLVVAQVAAALSAAHAQGIVHRDLKPENVMLVPSDDERGGELVKVLDFGIAKILDAPGEAKDGAPQERSETSTNLTRVGTVVGTPAYMSPEQCRGGELDGRSDVYSSGVLLYQLLTGQLPFLGETPLHTAMRHIHAPPRPPRELRPDLAEGLERIVLKALAKWPGERQQSAEQLREELLSVVDSLPDRDRVLGERSGPAPKVAPKSPPAAAGAAVAKAPARPSTTNEIEAGPRSLTREPTEHQLGMRLGGGLGKLVSPADAGKSVPPGPPAPGGAGEEADDPLERNETPIVDPVKRSAPPGPTSRPRAEAWDDDDVRTRLRPVTEPPDAAAIAAVLAAAPSPGRRPPAPDDDDDGPRTALMASPESAPVPTRARGARTLLMETDGGSPPASEAVSRSTARTQPQPGSVAPPATEAGAGAAAPGIRSTVRLGSPAPMTRPEANARKDLSSTAFARTQNAGALAAAIYDEASSSGEPYQAVKATMRMVADEASGGVLPAGALPGGAPPSGPTPGVLAPPLAPPPPPPRPIGLDAPRALGAPQPATKPGLKGSLEGLPGTTVLVVGVALGVVFSAAVILLVVFLARG